MKRISAFLSIMAAVLFLNISSAAADTIEIGLAWAGKSGMAKRVTQGFEEGMRELAPNVKIEMQKELTSIDDIAKVAAKWEKEKKGMVLLRSNATKWLGKNPPSIPTFIGACNHPGELGAVKNLNAPEGKITGVTYFLPVETQFEIFSAIIKDLKSVLLLLEKGHPSSLIDQEQTKEITAKLGIQYNEAFCSTKEEAVKAVKEFKGKVTAVIMGNQALIIDNVASILEAAERTPVVSYSSKPVEGGALGGFVADDVKLGQILAQSVVDVLIKGKSVKETPVKVDPAPKFYVNAKTAEKLGIEVPFSILETATVIQ